MVNVYNVGRQPTDPISETSRNDVIAVDIVEVTYEAEILGDAGDRDSLDPIVLDGVLIPVRRRVPCEDLQFVPAALKLLGAAQYADLRPGPAGWWKGMVHQHDAHRSIRRLRSRPRRARWRGGG